MAKVKLKKKRRGGGKSIISSDSDRTQQRSDNFDSGPDEFEVAPTPKKTKLKKDKKSILKIASTRFKQESSAYSPKAEYIDTRGTYDKSYSKKAENVTGQITVGRTTKQIGVDRDFAEHMYSSGDKTIRGGSWDRTGRTFTPSRESYTAKRTRGARPGTYTYSLEEVKAV